MQDSCGLSLRRLELGAEVGLCCKSGVLTADIMWLESNIRVNVLTYVTVDQVSDELCKRTKPRWLGKSSKSSLADWPTLRPSNTATLRPSDFTIRPSTLHPPPSAPPPSLLELGSNKLTQTSIYDPFADCQLIVCHFPKLIQSFTLRTLIPFPKAFFLSQRCTLPYPQLQ